MPKEILLYSAALCSDCQNLKRFMDAEGIPYELRDIKEHPEYAEELQQVTGKLGVPYLKIDGEWVRGYPKGEPFTEEFARGLFAG